jgi:hypothetical protein
MEVKQGDEMTKTNATVSGSEYWALMWKAADGEAQAYKNLAELQDKLLACYRTGKRPGALIDDIAAARAAVKKLTAAAAATGGKD